MSRFVHLSADEEERLRSQVQDLHMRITREVYAIGFQDSYGDTPYDDLLLLCGMVVHQLDSGNGLDSALVPELNRLFEIYGM